MVYVPLDTFYAISISDSIFYWYDGTTNSAEAMSDVRSKFDCYKATKRSMAFRLRMVSLRKNACAK